jgi:flavodoxin
MRIKLITLCTILMSLLTTALYAQNHSKKGTNMNGNKILVAFFSRADENYNVGYIKKGNTQIIAEIIAEQTGGTLFHIETVTPYPIAYKDCIDVARKELSSKSRPAIKGDIKIEDYDIIFLGYPNWWGDVPMAVYTFIEKHNWQGKNIIPFCTHEGSGLGNTENKLKNACKGATFQKGFAIQGTTAQNRQIQAKQNVIAWLSKVNF